MPPGCLSAGVFIKMYPKKVIALIDGFNLYHGIKSLHVNSLKWCDVTGLAEKFLLKNESVAKVLFYTAYPSHLPSGIRTRYQLYVDTLKQSGVKVIQGVFKEKERYINGRKHIFHEEKETDVRIAVDLIDLAYRKEADKFFVVSGDSDLRPAVERALERFDDISVMMLLPPSQHSKNFRRLEEKSHGRFKVMKIKRRHIQSSRFPDKVGSFNCPPEYLE